jgi:hypothetical protein
MRSLVALVLLMTACNRPPRAADRPADVQPGQSAARIITLERTPCYGTCPIYKVALDTDGNVRFEGRQNVAVMGEKRWSVSRDSAAALFRFADSIGFASLPAKYDFGEPGCSPFMAELPAFVITLEGSGTKRVHAEEGCPNIPAGLRQLRDRIDRVARIP